MGLATQLEQAAIELSTTSNAYTNAVTQLETTSGFLSGLAVSLVGNSWSGAGSTAFEDAWNRTYGDATNINTALSGTSGALNEMSATITDHLGPIRAAESSTASGSTLTSLESEAHQALHSIQEKAQTLSSTLQGDLSQSVGVCSLGTVSVPLSPSMTAPGTYWTGFMTAILMAEASKKTQASSSTTSSTTSSSTNTCTTTPGPSNLRTQKLLANLLSSLAPSGVTYGISDMTGGSTKVNIESAVTAYAAYLLTPRIKGKIGSLAEYLNQKLCDGKIAKEPMSTIVSNITSSVRNGVVIGMIGPRVVMPLIEKAIKYLSENPPQQPQTPYYKELHYK